MKIYQNEKNGERTSPEFERELDFFIPVGVVLIEIEECSDQKKASVLCNKRVLHLYD
jgi:hypothetical protein